VAGFFGTVTGRVTTLKPLQPAQLRWSGDTPEAELFGDIYFSRENGLAESRYVFLDGNRLRVRWQALDSQSTFVIGETGFGTGLNFLLAWQLWQETAPANAQLFFISTELHPLTCADLRHALACWPELAPLADALLQHYPPLIPGYHWLRLSTGDKPVTLLLLFGDANETLPPLADSCHPDFSGSNPWTVDAWFLDGFAPSKNPQLWQQALIGDIARLSKTGSTLATFTAAGQVRRDLAAHGFSVQKIPGYGSKREMVVAHFEKNLTTDNNKPETPWLLSKHRNPVAKNVTVIGAGMAGCHVARALAERNVRVTVIEKHPSPAQEASGNPQGALYTRLSANNAALSRFSLASLQYALRHYSQTAFAEAMHACGLLQLQDTRDEMLQDLFSGNPELAHWLDASEATQKSGINLQRGGWWLAQAGWINPQKLCHALLDHPLITTHYSCEISQLHNENSQWQLNDARGKTVTESSQIIIACANRAAAFTQTNWLPLRPVRGQISQLPATDTSQSLRCVVCDEGYVTPAANGQHCLGASFMPGDTDTALRMDEQQHNLRLLAEFSPALADCWAEATLQGRAALRCTTPDHLPLVGPLPDRDAFHDDYAALRHNAKSVIRCAGSYVEGLWLFGGFGGRGLCYIPLAAELLASQLLQQPRPLPRDIQTALAPARFVIRELVRTHAGR
jgi:tRNA 5-methylaminomethyl-2-thiouridine biosynthesis bifunctional protein